MVTDIANALGGVADAVSFRVVCICGGLGFPAGTASSKRIRLIGKSLVSTGVPFHVWHIGPSPFSENTAKAGDCEGITFEYLSPSIRWPNKRLQRILFYFWGMAVLTLKLLQTPRNTAVYVYYQGDLPNLLTLLLCRVTGIPVVQEACEWWPGTENGTPFHAWMYRNVMFHLSSGALAISHAIRDRIAAVAGPEYPVCIVPVLVDPAEISAQNDHFLYQAEAAPVLLWCGMVDGYIRDVYFLLDALAQLKKGAGPDARLRIVGPCSAIGRAKLSAHAAACGIDPARIEITGFVSDEQLWEYCMQADALLMPLWDDDRSVTRFPTKLGQYIAACRPIVTAPVGEIPYYLSEETAVFYAPGDAESLARAVNALLSDPARAESIVRLATHDVLPKLDCRRNSVRISSWFRNIGKDKQAVS